jgi:pSer/pThr/pTyr-binding forkhead associated (FHA) protein
VTIKVGGRTIPVAGDRAVIGRSRDCDVPLADSNVSRRHCEIVREQGTWYVVDLGSTNGTELNGRTVSRSELTDGDRITVGANDIVFGLPART